MQLAQQQQEKGKAAAIVLLAEQPKDELEEVVGSLRSETGVDIMVRTGLPYNLPDLALVAVAAAATVVIMIPPQRVRPNWQHNRVLIDAAVRWLPTQPPLRAACHAACACDARASRFVRHCAAPEQSASNSACQLQEDQRVHPVAATLTSLAASGANKCRIVKQESKSGIASRPVHVQDAISAARSLHVDEKGESRIVAVDALKALSDAKAQCAVQPGAHPAFAPALSLVPWCQCCVNGRSLKIVLASDAPMLGVWWVVVSSIACLHVCVQSSDALCDCCSCPRHICNVQACHSFTNASSAIEVTQTGTVPNFQYSRARRFGALICVHVSETSNAQRHVFYASHMGSRSQLHTSGMRVAVESGLRLHHLTTSNLCQQHDS